MGRTGYFVHPDCRLHDMGAGHPECPARIDAIEDRLLITGVADALERREPAPATMASCCWRTAAATWPPCEA